MGNVVQMKDWRNRMPKPKTDRDVVISEIRRLLEASINANKKIRSGGDYLQREAAAVEGLNLLMKAHEYAEKHGFKVKRDEDGVGNVSYTIVG